MYFFFNNLFMYSFTDKWDQICKYYFRNNTEGNIQDVQDGYVYKSLKSKGEFFLVLEHAGLVMCCDGVPVFKLSGMLTTVC